MAGMEQVLTEETGERLRCYQCAKTVSSLVPKGTLVRGIIECPECLGKLRERTNTREAYELVKKDESGTTADWRFTRLAPDRDILLARGYRLVQTWYSSPYA